MLRVVAALLAICVLGSCSGAQALKFLAGGGPSVAANVQAGANNVQGVQSDKSQAVRNVTGEVRQERAERQVRAERIETVVTHNYPPWLIIAFAVAVFLDSPLRWPGQILNTLRKRKEE